MTIEQRDWGAEHDALLPKLEEARRLLSGYPGVVAVDLGIKESGGDLTPVLAFRVYVSRKLPDSQLDANSRIPPSVLEVPTDVIEYSRPSLHDDVVRGGTRASTGGCLSSYGTLGCIAKRNSDNKIVILSNWHVFERVGEQVGQPGCVCLCCACGKIADVTKVQEDASVDCGIALLRDGVHATNVISGLNDDGSDGPLQGSGTVAVNNTVKKVGNRTGKTVGTVVSVTFPTSPEGETPKTNQILIKPTGAFPRFSDHGDSGSVVVNQTNVVIGLLYAGFDSGAMVGQTVACPISAVATAMDISIITGSFTQSGFPEKAADPGALTPEQAFEELRALVEATPVGRELVDRVTRHHVEIVELVNHNRRVTVAWHRGPGPHLAGRAGPVGSGANLCAPRRGQRGHPRGLPHRHARGAQHNRLR